MFHNYMKPSAFFSIEAKDSQTRFCSFQIIHDSSAPRDFLGNAIHFATGNLTNYLPTTFRVCIMLSRAETFDYATNNRQKSIFHPHDLKLISSARFSTIKVDDENLHF